MSWSISELDKNKAEQCVINEQIRLDTCKVILDHLKKEYEKKRYDYIVELSNIEDKITSIENSISSGEKFLESCKKHLNSF